MVGYLQYTKKRRLTPTDIHLPPKIGVSHLHIFEEGVFCRKTIKLLKLLNSQNIIFSLIVRCFWCWLI
ncbi:hypothetical protein CQZ94_28860 [Bacillus sp. MYb209]|nr:hypothetical protein CQZ94_28860 [Bacillus sp. MYb209]